MKNSEFLSALGGADADQYLWVAHFASNPGQATQGQWSGRMYQHKENQASLIDIVANQNAYFSPSVLSGLDESGSFKRSKNHFARLAALGVDDVQLDDINGQVSWIFETSPQNYQAGILIDEADADATNLALVDAVMSELADKGFIKADKSGNNAVRYMRLPSASNTKPRESGAWQVKVIQANLADKYSLADACAAFGIDLESLRNKPSTIKENIKQVTGSSHAELISALAQDEPRDRSYHDPLLKLSSKLISAGLNPGAVVEHLRGLMLAVKPQDVAEVARWQSRYDEIPRMVTGAQKFAPEPKYQPIPETGLLLDINTLESRSKAIKWLVKGMVPLDSIGVLFGASGAYKSFIAIDLGLHVAHAINWINRKTKSGPVVYVASEGGAGIYRRIAAWHKLNNRALPSNFWTCATPLVLTDEASLKSLRKDIDALSEKPSLIIVDTFSQTFFGDENAATDVSEYFRQVNTHLREPFGATVIVIHHIGHSNDNSGRPRGSSAFTANVDFLLAVRKEAELCASIEVTKQKDGDKISSQSFNLESQPLWTDDDGDSITSLAAKYISIVEQLKTGKTTLGETDQLVLDFITLNDAVTKDEVKAIIAKRSKNEKSAYVMAMRSLKKLQELKLIRHTIDDKYIIMTEAL